MTLPRGTAPDPLSHRFLLRKEPGSGAEPDSELRLPQPQALSLGAASKTRHQTRPSGGSARADGGGPAAGETNGRAGGGAKRSARKKTCKRQRKRDSPAAGTGSEGPTPRARELRGEWARAGEGRKAGRARLPRAGPFCHQVLRPQAPALNARPGGEAARAPSTEPPSILATVP